MPLALLRRIKFLPSITNSLLSTTQYCKLSSSKASTFSNEQDGRDPVNSRLHLSPLFSNVGKFDMNNCKIELVDYETWQVLSSLADVWRGSDKDKTLKMRSGFMDREGGDLGFVSPVDMVDVDLGFDAIEDMRIRGNLFYKLDKGSKEYEECSFDFRGRRKDKCGKESKGRKGEDPNEKRVLEVEETSKKDKPGKIKKNMKLLFGNEGVKNLIPQLEDSCIGKKKRSPTFKQLTAPYHEPFCLDIHITKGSARASVIHRATSLVVAVSHSISKDMKFDVGLTKNRSACTAVGEVLARRALADDIHTVVYTPRQGDKLEGKLEIVLKSIINGGLDVKVRVKQKKLRKTRALATRARD